MWHPPLVCHPHHFLICSWKSYGNWKIHNTHTPAQNWYKWRIIQQPYVETHCIDVSLSPEAIVPGLVMTSIDVCANWTMQETWGKHQSDNISIIFMTNVCNHLEKNANHLGSWSILKHKQVLTIYFHTYF